MENNLLTPRQIIESKIIPISLRQLMKLVKFWEEKKNNRLQDGINYILASNIGIWEKRSKWVIEKSELQEWIARSKERKSIHQ